MSMIFKRILRTFLFTIVVAGGVANAQEGPDVAATERDSGLLDQVVPVAEDDASAEAPPSAPPSAPPLSPKAELLQQFETYKRLMNEGIYDEADTVAKRIVTLAIEITGPRSSETAKALTNLGIVQHRNKQFDAAQQNFASAIDIIEEVEDRLNGRLINPLKGLGAAQLEAGRPDLAKQSFNRAMHITHVNQGPHNMAQIEILESLAETNVRLGSVEEARAMHDMIYILHQRRYDDDQLALVPSLMSRAEWQHRAGYIMDEQATYRRAIRIIEENADKKDIRLIEPLTRLGESYYYTDMHEDQGLHHNPVTGEIYFKRALRIAESHPESSWAIAASSKISLGDFYMMQGMHSRARKLYQEVWEFLARDKQRLTFRDQSFSEAMPLNQRPLPEFAGDSNESALSGASDEYEQGSVTVSYNVTDRGRVIGVEAVEVYPPEFVDMERDVHREIRGRLYRPRYEQAEADDEAKPVRSEGQVFTHRFYYQQSDLDQRREAASAAEST
jgi:tetratricopeptide (TPR) repeat protein